MTINVHMSVKMFAILWSLTALLLISATNCAPSGPTLNDLMSFHCPSNRPFKCLPYGACCKGSEFCYSGMCESCFPRDIGESELLDWCREKGQFNVTLMRNDGCHLACQDMFNSTQLAHVSAHEHSSLDEKINSTNLPIGRLQAKDIHEHYLIIVNIVLVVYLVVSLPVVGVLIYVVCRKRRCRRKYYLSESLPDQYPLTPSSSKQSAIDFKNRSLELKEFEKAAMGQKSEKENDLYVLRYNSEPNLLRVADHDRKKEIALNRLGPNAYKSYVPINEAPTDVTSDASKYISEQIVADVEVHAKQEEDRHRTADESTEISGENNSQEVTGAHVKVRDSFGPNEAEPLLTTQP